MENTMGNEMESGFAWWIKGLVWVFRGFQNLEIAFGCPCEERLCGNSHGDSRLGSCGAHMESVANFRQLAL